MQLFQQLTFLTYVYVCIVYDVARPETFESLSNWLKEVEQFTVNGGKEVVKLLVGKIRVDYISTFLLICTYYYAA